MTITITHPTAPWGLGPGLFITGYVDPAFCLPGDNIQGYLHVAGTADQLAISGIFNMTGGAGNYFCFFHGAGFQWGVPAGTALDVDVDLTDPVTHAIKDQLIVLGSFFWDPVSGLGGLMTRDPILDDIAAFVSRVYQNSP